MKILTLLLAALTLTFTVPVYAQQGDNNAAAIEHTISDGDVHVNVNGLVCDFCARALEKVFAKESAVKGIDVNLDDKVVTINFVEGQSLDDDRITKLIMDSGYNVESIHRVK